MNILITGASGLIGSAVSRYLSEQGHHVFSMSRTQPSAPFYWSLNAANEWNIQWDEGQAIDAVIHLAGESLGNRRWSKEKKQRIYDSRIDSTRALVAKMKTLTTPPSILLSASAIGYYGNAGDETLDENSPMGNDFLADLAANWEAEANAAKEFGTRVVNLRTGLVLSPDGGALESMLPAFKSCVGGKLGSGQQYMSWVSLGEIKQMIAFLLNHPGASGPFNLVTPYTVRNANFTNALASELNRPAKINMPAFMVNMIFGEMGELLLLSSAKVQPANLAAIGYEFSEKDLAQTFKEILG